jgi:cytoskeleton protein RodZ
MSEIEAPRAENETEIAPAGFGRRLTAERTRLGLSIDEIAARLRLHPKQVQAIENQSLPALPAPFVRGFVRNYAKELRLDPAPMLAELNAMLGPQAGASQRMATNNSPSGLAAPSDHGSRRVVVVGALAALIGLAVVGGLATRSDNRQFETATNVPKAVEVARPQPAVATVEPKPEQAPSAPAAEAVAPASAAPAVPASVVATESVRMNFHEQAWVEVIQADGRIVHSQINEAGTEQRIDGKPPLKLVIGNASAVALEYKGRAIDRKSVMTADHVARITLN